MKLRHSRLASVAPVVVSVLFALAGAADARLAVRPPVPVPVPTPVGPSPSEPTPTPAPNPVGDPDLCRSSLRNGMQSLAATAAEVYGACAQRGFECLLTSSASLCCAREVEACRDDLTELERVRSNLRWRLSSGRCAGISYDELVREDGFDLGAVAGACARLEPMGASFDRAGLADCVDRLITEDVYARVTRYDVPRAAEAFACLGLESDELAVAGGADPATCLPPPPTPTPVAPPPPTTTPSPGPAPTPSPGPDGCQPALGGPCDDGTFTHCCVTTQHCAPTFISPAIGGFCFAGAPTPTPAPTATPGGSATPAPTETPAPSTTPAPTATPAGPTPTPGNATPTPGSTPTPGVCSTATLRIAVDFTSNEASGIVASIDYPATSSLPGTGGDSSVLARVTKLNSAAGLFNVGDNDGGSPPHELTVGLVVIPGPIASGDFAEVRFDCEGATPRVEDFDCTPEVSNLLGGSIPAACDLTLTTSP